MMFILAALLAATAGETGVAPPADPPACCAVFELRNYELKQGRRRDLAALFDAEFVETQEAYGLKVVGQFLDVEHPTRYVWIRASRDHQHRRAALSAFYDESTAWKTFGRRASDTMTSIDDVYLLKPAYAGAEAGLFAPLDEQGGRCGVISILIFDLSDTLSVAEEELHAMAQAGWGAATFMGALRSDHAPNSFPRHPVRTDADVLALVLRHRDAAAYYDFLASMKAMPAWSAFLTQQDGEPAAPARTLLLQPTPRSRLQ